MVYQVIPLMLSQIFFKPKKTKSCFEGSIVGPLFFLIYINDLSDDFTANPKLFADDTSLLSIVQNINSTTTDLNSD